MKYNYKNGGICMKNSPGDFYRVIKAFNNNVLLVLHNNKEKILYSKGIGFAKKPGDMVSAELVVDKIFSLEDKTNSNKFNQLMVSVDSELIGLCQEIIFMIGKELNEDLNEKIHVSLTDHIAFTFKRLKSNDEIVNPFIIETETLYKREFDIATKAIRLMEKRTGLKIPDGEIGFIALHIHSARQQGKLSNTIKYAYLSNSIIEHIEESLGIAIDRYSIDYARFITHLRFAIERILNNNPIRNELLSAIKKQYSKSYKLSRKISNLIEEYLDVKVPEDESGYLAVHIEKLRNADK
jgi:transcriptional antiterminator